MKDYGSKFDIKKAPLSSQNKSEQQVPVALGIDNDAVLAEPLLSSFLDIGCTIVHTDISRPIHVSFSSGNDYEAAPLSENSSTVAEEFMPDLLDGCNSSEQISLLYNAYKGHVEELKSILSSADINLNAANKEGATALMFASLAGHAVIVEQLLERKDVKINVKTNKGVTALMLAAAKGHSSIVERLLTRSDIDINAKSDKGATALMFAAWLGHADIVNMMLACPGIEINSKDDNGDTALIVAARNGNIAVLDLLMAHSSMSLDDKKYFLNALIKDLDKLDPDSIEMPNGNKVNALARVIRLLPSGFLLEWNYSVLLKVLGKISVWLDIHYLKLLKSEEQAHRLIPILEIYADMIDSFIDNKKLHKVEEIARKILNSTNRKELLEANYKKFLCNEFCDSEDGIEDDYYLYMRSIYMGSIVDLSAGVNKLCDNQDIRVKYLANYITKAITGLERSKKKIKETIVIRESMYLLAGAKSMGLISESLGDGGYFLNDAMLSMQNFEAKNEGWYYLARYLNTVIREANGNPGKLRHILTEITNYYNANNIPCWQICYTTLNSLFLEIVKQDDKSLKSDFLSLVLHIALDERYSFVPEVQISAIEVLISASSCRDEEIKEKAKNLISDSIYFKFVANRNNMPRFLVDRIINICESGRSSVNDKSDSLLSRAMRKLLPIDYNVNYMAPKLADVRKQATSSDNLSIYIPPLGSVEKDEASSLDMIIERSIEKNNSTTFLIGSPGSGKSTFCLNFAEKYFYDYEEVGTIPLFIYLPSLDNQNDNIIEQALDFYGWSNDEISLLKKECSESSDAKRLLVIIDGFDESSSSVNIYDMHKTLAWPNIRLIITCDDKNFEKMSSNRAIADNTHEIVSILPFNDNHIRSFIGKKIIKWRRSNNNDLNNLSSAEFESFILDNKNLADLSRNPAILEMLMEVLPELNHYQGKLASLSNAKQDKDSLYKITRYDVYKAFRFKWFEEKGMQLRSQVDFFPVGFVPEVSSQSYAVDVAEFMLENNIRSISYKSVKNIEGNSISQKGSRFFGSDIKALSLMVAPLKKVGHSSYYFTNKIFRDFFVAKSIISDINLIVTGTYGKLPASSILNRVCLQDYPEVLSFILDVITQKEQDALEKIILSTREDTRYKIVSSIAKAAANALILYLETSDAKMICGRNWSYTQIDGVDITGAYFYNMNFTGSIWRNIRARSLRSYYSKFDDIKLEGFSAESNDSFDICGYNIRSIYSNNLYSLLKFNNKSLRVLLDKPISKNIYDVNDSKNHFNSIAISGDYLFSGELDKTIKVWDTASGSVLKVLEGHTDHIISLCVEDSYLFSASKDRTFRIWNIDSGECVHIESFNFPVIGLQLYDKHLVSLCSGGVHFIWDIEDINGIELVKQINEYENFDPMLELMNDESDYKKNSEYTNYEELITKLEDEINQMQKNEASLLENKPEFLQSILDIEKRILALSSKFSIDREEKTVMLTKGEEPVSSSNLASAAEDLSLSSQPSCENDNGNAFKVDNSI